MKSTSRSKTLGVGVIGLGVGKHHLKTYFENSQCKVIWACDLSIDKFDQFSTLYPDVRFTTNADDVLSDSRVNLVSIASFDNYHCDQIVKAIETGKHVFAEKPLCLTRTELVRIQEALRTQPDVKLSANMVLRACPLFKSAAAELKSGNFGEILFAEADYLWGRRQKLVNGWRNEISAYSIILGAAIHMVDLIVWMLGEKPIEVVAYGNNIATKGSSFKPDSFAVMLLQFQNGCVAKVTGNGACVHPHFHGLKLYGTKKTVVHDLQGGMLIDSPGDMLGNISELTDPYPAKEFRSEILTSFIDSIVGNRDQPIVRQQEIFDVMNICLSAEESSKGMSGQKIRY